MNSYTAQIKVQLKPDVNDPQGLVIMDSLKRLGFADIASFRAGKYFELQLNAASQKKAEASVKEMCASLLAQPVTEFFEISVLENAPKS